MKTIRICTLTLTGLALAAGLFAQTQPRSHDHADQKATPTSKSTAKSGMMDDKMMAQCKEMMQKHDQMQADIKAQDASLDDLMMKVNTSADTDKVGALTAVVNELIAQRKTQRDNMASMQSGMMQHMMEHMQMGKMSMSMCPMMKGMQTSKSVPDNLPVHK